jgi:hypothetical protein
LSCKHCSLCTAGPKCVWCCVAVDFMRQLCSRGILWPGLQRMRVVHFRQVQRCGGGGLHSVRRWEVLVDWRICLQTVRARRVLVC